MNRTWGAFRNHHFCMAAIPVSLKALYTDAVAMIDLRITDPSGIANAMVMACREVQAEGGSMRADAAARLMATRLARVCGATGEPEDYPQLVAVCRLRPQMGPSNRRVPSRLHFATAGQ
jgi:hypothetical protein